MRRRTRKEPCKCAPEPGASAPERIAVCSSWRRKFPGAPRSEKRPGGAVKQIPRERGAFARLALAQERVRRKLRERGALRSEKRPGGAVKQIPRGRRVRAWPYSLFRIQSQVSPGAARPAVPVPFRRLLSCKPPGAARPPASRWRRSVRRKLPRHGRSIVRHDHQAPGPPQTAAFPTGAPDKRPAAPLTAFHRGFGACLQRSRKYS